MASSRARLDHWDTLLSRSVLWAIGGLSKASDSPPSPERAKNTLSRISPLDVVLLERYTKRRLIAEVVAFMLRKLLHWVVLTIRSHGGGLL
jgi:hypothetical protein